MARITPFLAGIAGAAQLSTACALLFPVSDIGLTGAAGPYLLFSVPGGAALGMMLGWLLLRLPPSSKVWKDWQRTWLWATGIGFLVAPMAPGFLGLAPQTPAQLWQGLALLTAIGWVFLFFIAFVGRRGGW